MSRRSRSRWRLERRSSPARSRRCSPPPASCARPSWPGCARRDRGRPMRIPFSYIWRSLWARRLTTGLTLGGVALVVFVFAGVLMLARGLEATLVDTGSPENAIVLRRSAGAELVSPIDRGTPSVLETQAEGAPAKDRRPLLSRGGGGVVQLHKKTAD